MKPRLPIVLESFCVHSLLMLPSTSHREALLACPPFAAWNLPSFTMESTISFLCSRSDLLFSCQGAALAHLNFLSRHDLVLWTDGSIPFPFGKGGSGVIANCSLCGTEATLSFSAGPVCSSFSAKAYAILHALCWSRQHQQVCHFSYLTLVLSSAQSFLYLSGKNWLLSPVPSDYNGSPDNEVAGQTGSATCTLCNPLWSLSSYPLVFFLTGGVLPH